MTTNICLMEASGEVYQLSKFKTSYFDHVNRMEYLESTTTDIFLIAGK